MQHCRPPIGAISRLTVQARGLKDDLVSSEGAHMIEQPHPVRRISTLVFCVVCSVAASVAGCSNSPATGHPSGAAGTPGSAAAGTSGGAGTTDSTGSAGTSAAGADGTGSAGTGAAGTAAGTGVAGTTGIAGASGSAGAPGAAGAAGGTSDGSAGAIATSDAGVLTTRDFVCTELVGLWVASQWWPTFEKGVDGDHWEFMFQHHGYLELFADPTSPYWNNAVSSKCTAGAATPDRVVFLPFSLTLDTMDEWMTNLTQVVQTIKGKFPGVKRIELMTTLRAPGNMLCANDSYPFTLVAPYVDDAIQEVADNSGGLVTVGPKIEVGSCDWWAGEGTDDLTGAGDTGAGQLLAAYYQTH
jgi:hypothetical protein